jgi:hypothetical protein
MLSKCANPDCNTPFRYLRDGKLFRLDVGKLQAPSPVLLESKKPSHHIEHFWLCGRCVQSMTLGWEAGNGVRMVPLRAPMVRAAKAS